MSIETKNNPAGNSKSTLEALHRDAVIGALELKLRVVRYRAHAHYTGRQQFLDRILTRVQGILGLLVVLPPNGEANGFDEDPEHIGVIARRELANMAAGWKAGGSL